MSDGPKSRASVHPVSLRNMARSIAASYSDTGAIVITKGADGYRFGVEGMTPDEVERAACLLINYNITFLDDEAT